MRKEEDIKNIISLLSLEKLLNRHPYDISGGEQQHLALGKILLLDPEILLLDEPTKGTDGGFKEELCMILKKLSDSGKTVVMVSTMWNFVQNPLTDVQCSLMVRLHL